MPLWFPLFAINFPWNREWPFVWTDLEPLQKRSFVPSLVKIDQLLLGKSLKCDKWTNGRVVERTTGDQKVQLRDRVIYKYQDINFLCLELWNNGIKMLDEYFDSRTKSTSSTILSFSGYLLQTPLLSEDNYTLWKKNGVRRTVVSMWENWLYFLNWSNSKMASLMFTRCWKNKQTVNQTFEFSNSWQKDGLLQKLACMKYEIHIYILCNEHETGWEVRTA